MYLGKLYQAMVGLPQDTPERERSSHFLRSLTELEVDARN